MAAVDAAAAAAVAVEKPVPAPRGLHLSTSWLNVSAFYEIRGAFRSCLGVVYGVLGSIRGYYGV